MKKFIHVNQLVIRHNKKYGNNLPPCRVQEGNLNRYCREVEILGPSQMVYHPDKPLPCGAKVWIETEAQVVLIDEVPYRTIRKAMEEMKK